MDRLTRAVTLSVGVARAATGVWFLAAPTRPTQAWVGDTGVPSRYLARTVGGRDLAIGSGLILAAITGSASTTWLAASVASDLTDAIAGTAMLEGPQRRNAIGFAGGFGALGALVLAMSVIRD